MDSQQKTQEPNHNGKEQNTTLTELPKDTRLGFELVQHQGFWIMNSMLPTIILLQANFEAQPTDIFITGMPKTGNTWLKSLVFATVRRHDHPISESPLLHRNPAHLMWNLDFISYTDKSPVYLDITLAEKQPRLFGTHLSYDGLPQSIKDNGCKMIYICRNPLDTIVSTYFFLTKVEIKDRFGPIPSIEEFYEIFSQGVTSFGPFFEHVLGFWKKAKEMPSKIYFLNYEDLLMNTPSELKRMAEFMGCPFTPEEEKDGLIDDIVKLCSFKNLKELKVNKEGKCEVGNNSMFFRKGEIGDWVNYFTPSMADRMFKLMKEKFDGYDVPINETVFKYRSMLAGFALSI